MRSGIDRRTGRLLTGWDHCAQSLAVILTTRVGTRVMRRAFGSAALDLQDRAGTPKRIMQIYAAVAAAIRRWEPGFRLRSVALTAGGADGVFVFDIAGTFYPRGHLGDYSLAESRSAVLASSDSGFATVAT